MKYLLIALIFPFLFGCQKNEKKQLPRCIYDQSVFAQACLEACQSEEKFSQFKRDPYFNLLWENYSYEEGSLFLGKIEEKYPHLLKRIDGLSAVDSIGDAQTYAYKDYGVISPYTLRMLWLTGCIEKQVGNLDGKSVVQIGAGYGGLACVLHHFFAFENYSIIDLPEQLQLAQKYLEKCGITTVRYIPFNTVSTLDSYDVVISDLSFSEFQKKDQEFLIEKVLLHAHSGFFLGHQFPKHYGVAALPLDELKTKLKSKEFFQNSMDFRGNYQIFWTR